MPCPRPLSAAPASPLSSASTPLLATGVRTRCLLHYLRCCPGGETPGPGLIEPITLREQKTSSNRDFRAPVGSQTREQKDQDIGMGGSKGKTHQRRARPGRPASAERESGSASADCAPSRDRRPDRGKARKTKPATESEAPAGKETAGGRRKPTEEGNHRCRSAEIGTSQETQERQSSSQRLGHGPTESRESENSCGEHREEQRIPGEEERTVKRGRRKRGKGSGTFDSSRPWKDAWQGWGRVERRWWQLVLGQ